MEYSGYNPNWVLGQHPGTPYYYVPLYLVRYDLHDKDWVIAREWGAAHVPRKIRRHYTQSYGVPLDEYDYGYYRSPARVYQFEDAYEHSGLGSGFVRLAWPTEIPTELRVRICCERCRHKLYKDLINLDGVYDVGISGRSNALVAVTGTAPAHEILERARRSSKYAEFWSENSDHKRWR